MNPRSAGTPVSSDEPKRRNCRPLDSDRPRHHNLTRVLISLGVALLGITLARRNMSDGHLHSTSSRSNPARYIITGAFGSSSLYVLEFDPSRRYLEVVQNIQAYGPHQYLCYNRSTQRLYTTSWDEPPKLSAWSIVGHQSSRQPIKLINQAPINSVSSYITTKDGMIFSVGGPTGEVHQIDLSSGGFGKKLQDLYYVGEDRLDQEDKSRKALRFGSHAIEISIRNQAFVPHLGHNSIWMYNLNPETSQLELVSQMNSPESHDSPRHCVVSRDGRWLYVVTEHTQRVDVYAIDARTLIYRTSSSIIPEASEPSKYRGDTIRLLPVSNLNIQAKDKFEWIFATTRGVDPSIRGMLTIFQHELETGEMKKVIDWETPTSGGKANAIEFEPDPPDPTKIYLVLTDDEHGWINVLRWNHETQSIEIVARSLIDDDGIGASHALWLS